MLGFVFGAMMLAALAKSAPQEHPVSLGHAGPHYLVRVARPHCVRHVQVIEVGTRRLVWQGEWEGDGNDFEGMVREAQHERPR
jgi:hypothetical protein